MRQIGTLPGSTDPNQFGDYLLSLGVTSRAVQTADGWAIWVHDEDQVPRARAEFQAYEKDPTDPRFSRASVAAEEVRRERARRDRQYRKQVHDMAGRYDGLNVRGRPLTLALVVVCVAIYVAQRTTPAAFDWIDEHLTFFSFVLPMIVPAQDPSAGLNEILHGQVWRLFSPALLHGNLVHLVFNMYWALILGTLIEHTRGTSRLAWLTLVSALLSNLGQYLYILAFYPRYVGWVGFSGVAYAYFGYVWMKSWYEPEQGMHMPPSTVRLMLIWLSLGLLGFMNMANGAHIGGLLAGMLFGLAGL